MKIWIKVLVGSVLGILLGAFLPAGPKSMELFSFLSRLLIQIGRYVLFPLIFGSLAIGTFELRRERILRATYARLILYLVGATVVLVVVGILTVIIFSPQRIPIPVAQESATRLPGIKETLLGIFPSNLFQALVGSGQLLIPVVVLAFLLGLNLNFDLRVTTPTVELLDSLNRIFYHLNSLVCELFAFAMVVVSAFFLMTLRQNDLGMFKQIIMILTIDAALVIFAVYPLLLYFLGERDNPYKWLYASIAPALVAFFSGDQYLPMTMLIKHGHENLGVPRRVGSAVYSLFAVFGRAGTAMVSAAGFLLVLKSYSTLEVSFLQVLWTILFTTLVSMALGSVPGLGAFVALSTLCGIYGRGIEEGYLILRPIAPLLVSYGVILDVIGSAFVSLLVSRQVKVWREVDLYDFV
jgi:aerobic C4-dicarboxylate transport protein